MFWYFLPASLRYRPLRRQLHFFINNIAKYTFMVICADGDKILAGLGVVIFFQPHGLTAMRSDRFHIISVWRLFSWHVYQQGSMVYPPKVFSTVGGRYVPTKEK